MLGVSNGVWGNSWGGREGVSTRIYVLNIIKRTFYGDGHNSPSPPLSVLRLRSCLHPASPLCVVMSEALADMVEGRMLEGMGWRTCWTPTTRPNRHIGVRVEVEENQPNMKNTPHKVCFSCSAIRKELECWGGWEKWLGRKGWVLVHLV